jgi:hypothetical protein
MSSNFSVVLTAVSGLAGTIIGASISAYYSYMNSSVARKIKQKDLYRLVRSELLNLRRHYRLTATELSSSERPSVGDLRKAQYKDTGMLALDVKEIYILNENLCQDIMQIILFTRNNDIELDEVIKSVACDHNVGESKIHSMIPRLVRRFHMTAQISDLVLSRLEKHSKNPDRYDEPQISW